MGEVRCGGVCTWCFNGADLNAPSQLVNYEGRQGLGLDILWSKMPSEEKCSEVSFSIAGYR